MTGPAPHAFAKSELAFFAIAAITLPWSAWLLFSFPSEALLPYLQAVFFWLGLPLGALFFLMVFHITGGSWGKVLAPALRQILSFLPLLALLFLPIAFGLHILYDWSLPGHLPTVDGLSHLGRFLNPTAFFLRAAGFFVVWVSLAFYLRQPQRPKARQVSSLGLILLVLTVSFASVDWVMSLYPKWYSSVFGLIVLSSQASAGLSAAIILTQKQTALRHAPNTPLLSDPSDLGSLLLTAVLTQVYLQFSQFIILWSANEPRGMSWYNARYELGWDVVTWLLLGLLLVLPFTALLWRKVKRNPFALTRIAWVLLCGQWLLSVWFVMPRAGAVSLHGIVMLVVMSCAIGSLCLLVHARSFRRMLAHEA